MAARKAVHRPIKRSTCSECGGTVLQRVLGRHMRTVHGRGQQHTCKECNQGFPRKDSLTRHQKEQHSHDIDPVECARCGAQVCQRGLKEHLNSRKCREKLNYFAPNNSTRSIRSIVCIKDADAALLSSARYLVLIRERARLTRSQMQQLDKKPSKPIPLPMSADIALLQVRHETLKTLMNSLKSEDVSVRTLGAIWAFGVADTILGQDPDSHAAALSKMQKFQNRRAAMLRAIERAYRYWSTPKLVTRQTLILWKSPTEQRLDLDLPPMTADLYRDIAEISELRSVQSNIPSVPGSNYNWFCLSLDYDENGAEKDENVVSVSTEEALFIQSVRRSPWCEEWLGGRRAAAQSELHPRGETTGIGRLGKFEFKKGPIIVGLA